MHPDQHGRDDDPHHDTLNERVRAGLEQIDFYAVEKVRHVDLDFVQGRVQREGPHKDKLWWGLGLVVTGADLGDDTWPSAYPAPEVIEAFSASLVASGQLNRRLGYDQARESSSWLPSSDGWSTSWSNRGAGGSRRRSEARSRFSRR